MKRAVLIHQSCDKATEYLLYTMTIFSPWALGTTDPWAIWTMNIGGYLIGLLLFLKWIVRKKTKEVIEIREAGHFLTNVLGGLTVVLLIYCLVSALNARATFNWFGQYLEYHECIRWLPHSYDRPASWQAFWNYLALAFVFWGFRDWILIKEENEKGSRIHRVPNRLRRFLWVLSINGSLLCIEGLIQRISGTSKLLWLVEPKFLHPPDHRFGPYVYRGNAAELLNLIWPATLGLWWSLHHSGSRRKANNLLLPCVVLMATSTLITLSRGGVIIATFCAVAGVVVVVAAQKNTSWRTRLGFVSMMAGIFVFAAYINGDKLSKRFSERPDDILSGRPLIYKVARNIADDFPVFGAGPKAFGPVSRVYLTPGQLWYTEVHDDWLETRATFGWVGFSLILIGLISILARWFSAGGLYTHWSWIAFYWITVGGCLIHARFDFPLQNYSILFVFLIECAVLFSCTRKK